MWPRHAHLRTRQRSVPPRAQARELTKRERDLERALRLGRQALVQESHITAAALRVIDSALALER